MKINNTIKNFLLSGDSHGRVIDRLNEINTEIYPPAETALIILGDAGINFYLNKSDRKLKEKIQSTGYTIYCVRGNHEERPENLPDIEIIEDINVSNEIYYEPNYPNIRYFIDGNEYNIKGFSCLIIGGAYSVDKEHRLLTNRPWFKDELLTAEEMAQIEEKNKNKHFNFILTHTAPLSFEPKHLFLDFIDQSKVDKSMETWLEHFKDLISWDAWCFGHYHDDTIICKNVKMYYYLIEPIERVYEYWYGKNE